MITKQKLSLARAGALLLASLSFSGACLAGGSPAADSRAALCKDYRVTGITAKSWDKLGEMPSCARFSLSESAIRRFLQRARPTDREEEHARFYHFPCSVTATLEGKTLSATLEVNASGVATLRPKGGEVELLVCETACEDLLAGQ